MYKCLKIYFFFIVVSIISSFSLDMSSFDAYGLKVAVNDILLVKSVPSDFSFFVRLTPFNYPLSCTIAYNDSDQYIYAVAVNSRAKSNDTIRFLFIGINTETYVPFIGSMTYTGITVANYISTIKSSRKPVFPCNGWQANNYRIHQLEQFKTDDLHEDDNNDFFVVTVAPTGQFGYAFAKRFLVVYDLDRDTVSTQLGNVTWPDKSFLPHAVDVNSDLLFVVFGYLGDSNSKFTPCAYLLNISNSTFTVLDTWSYTPPSNTSWQASLTNWDADVYTPKYDLSVSMNDDGDEVLFGIQITNTIIVLYINKTSQKFGSSLQMLSNGKAIGMGKSVGWIDENLIVVLVNKYSLNYVWSSSQMFVYNITVTNNLTVRSIFPNLQQTLPPTFGPILLSLVVTQNDTVVILDSQGNHYILLPSPAGSFSDTSSTMTSSPLQCIGGTFSLESSIFPCSLCDSGTTTDGLIGQSVCVPCTNNVFCPLGAAFGSISASSSLLTNVNQAHSYPVSPQSIRFDNILIENMLIIRVSPSLHCLVISPLFWVVIVILCGILIWLIMFILERYVTNPLGKKTHQRMKRFLKKTDLIGEGEMVIGGLFTFAIIVLLIFAFTFSNAYLHRYPIENVHEDAEFACDPTLTNAQFSSGLMSTGIPPNNDEKPIFELLDSQLFTLHIDFINTLFKCTDVTVLQIKDINIPMTISSCEDTDGSLSFSLLLPSHNINLRILLDGTNTIGGIRIGLEGSGKDLENETLEATYSLIDLNFAQSLSVVGRILTQQPSCTIQLSKVINRTYPLGEDGETQFSGLWLPILSGTLDQMFIDGNEYKYATSTSTTLSIVISESSYYTLNTQRPITSQDELIFANLLFTIVCLEIFGLGFLISELIIIPLLKRLFGYCRRQNSRENFYEKNFDQPEIFVTQM